MCHTYEIQCKQMSQTAITMIMIISMFDNCLIDIYPIFMKQWYIYHEYDIVHPNLCKVLSKM